MLLDKRVEFFQTLCRKPRLAVQHPGFSSVCAYLDGYDYALQGGALVGFREWLLAGTKDWSNLPWWALIRLRVDPNDDLSSPPPEEKDEALLAELVSALEGYSKTYMAGGLPKVFHEYNMWLLGSSGPFAKDLREELRGSEVRRTKGGKTSRRRKPA